MAEHIIWVCDNCGWSCPETREIPLSEAECDNCGDELIEVSVEVTIEVTRDA